MSYAVEEVGGLDELGSERVLRPVHPEVGGESFRQEVVALYDLIQHLVNLNRSLDVAFQHLHVPTTAKMRKTFCCGHNTNVRVQHNAFLLIGMHTSAEFVQMAEHGHHKFER